MKGYTTNIVNLIADNLRDRYTIGQIIKELIQNADDAKHPYAKRFEFGWHPGFSESTNNPLLMGPGLYFFNDGGFSKDDERAISSFAENSKAGEDDVIGKYGFGMKSVFHLCEAFFYLGYNSRRGDFREGINPWKQGDNDLHPDWGQISAEDWLSLENVARTLVGTHESASFLLWLPLRRRDHLKTHDDHKTGCIKEEFPGDDPSRLTFLKAKDLPQQLATFLPFLQHIEKIRYYPEHPGEWDRGFQIELNTSNRIDHQAKNSESSGRVEILPENASFPFTALQARKDLEIFNRLNVSATKNPYKSC